MTKERTGTGELKGHRKWRPAELKENLIEFTISPWAVLSRANSRPEGCLLYLKLFKNPCHVLRVVKIIETESKIIVRGWGERGKWGVIV